MAGIIQQQMGPKPAQEQPDALAPEATQEGAEVEQNEAPDEENPEFQKALSFAYEALYKNEAAKDIAKQLKSAPDGIADAMSNIAYEVTSIVDERTDGGVPDELLGLLAMSVLSEVGDIAEAAGLDPSPEDIATAFKDMLLRYLGENGMDTSQLQQAMDSVDPSVFKNAGAEV